MKGKINSVECIKEMEHEISNYLRPRIASHFAKAIRTEYYMNRVGLTVGDDETSICN